MTELNSDHQMTADAAEQATGVSVSPLRRWLPLGLGVVLAFVALELVRTQVFIQLEEAALGAETQNVYTGADGRRVLCQDARDHTACRDAYVNAGRPRAILWLGNSQMAAINRYEPGDSTAPATLHDIVKNRGHYVVTYAQPNANLLEHAVTFAAATQAYDLVALILPVFMDDMREQGVRERIAELVVGDRERQTLEASPMWPAVAPFLVAGSAQDIETPKHSPSGSAEQPTQSLQERVEDGLTSWLDDNWALWSKRVNLRGTWGFMVHTMRNKLLGINAQTKRRVDPGVYAGKMAVLEAILLEAKRRSIKVLLYVPPYRQDIPGPYIESDYTRFKSDLAQKATDRSHVSFVNLEALVAGPEWGMVVDRILGFQDYDFMHFTVDGHRRHAQAVDENLITLGF